MPLTVSDYVLWATGTVLQLSLCGLAYKRRLVRHLPLFTAYLVLVTTYDAFNWWFYLKLGYGSRTAFYYYWVSQGVLLVARGLIIAEICWQVLRPYCGIWGLARWLLAGGALFLVCNAAVAASGNTAWIALFILSGERGLELAVIVVLILLFALCRYYGIRVRPLLAMVALGLGLYSAVQIANNSLRGGWMTNDFPWWKAVRIVSSQVALLIWGLALRKPLPGVEPRPALLEKQLYDELVPQVNYRLRELNDRLREMLG